MYNGLSLLRLVSATLETVDQEGLDGIELPTFLAMMEFLKQEDLTPLEQGQTLFWLTAQKRIEQRQEHLVVTSRRNHSNA